MRRFKFIIWFALCFAIGASAQTTTVSGTVTDPDSLNWASGTINFRLYNSASGTPSINGVPLTAAQLTPSFTMNSSGAFTGSVSDNNQIQPIGTQWDISVCPAASAPCQQMQRITITGASQSLTSTINGQLRVLRFPSSYTARAYNAVEISPIPPAGGTYYDLTLGFPLYWTGTAWVGFGSNTGITPHTPANSVQTANSAVSAFNSDPNMLIDPTTHTFQDNANMHLNAMESIPRSVYDPMDTKYDGGLAAAIAGSSGFTPTQVIQATVDYAECQLLMGVTTNSGRITLPNIFFINLGQVQLWSNQEFSGDSLRSHPSFQHNDATKAMITGHVAGDTITCSNSQTYTPGRADGVLVQNIAISGMGNVSGTGDIGILENGVAWFVYNIIGFSNGFGSQGVFDAGFENFTYRVGYPAAQIKGCQSFIAGTLTGSCQAVEISGGDSEVDYVYATDNQQFSSGHAAGPCYPNCAAIGLNNANIRANDLFGQISDIDILVTGFSIRGSNWRMDGTSREGLYFNATEGGDIINNLISEGACTDTALQSNYNAGIATGCSAIKGQAGSNQITNIQAGAAAGIFGPSFLECLVNDNSAGNTASGSTYSLLAFGGNPDHTGRNDRAYCGSFDGSTGSGRVVFPSMSPLVASTATADVSGITSITLSTTTPLTNIVGGIGAQKLTILSGILGATVAPGGNISTCTKLPEKASLLPITFVNTGGYTAPPNFNTDNNAWHQVCNDPQADYVHLNWATNPTPSPGGAVVDFYGNEQARQIALPNLAPSVQLHGPTVGSGQYCFEQEALYADGSHTVTALACTTVDLAHQTPGAVFAVPSSLAVTFNLYLVSNTTGSGIPTGKYPAFVNGAWDGPTVIAAGGDGTTPPAATENTTGLIFANWGVANSTASNTQPPCIAATRGRQWMISGGGTGPDTFQICVQTTGGTYAWVTH